MIKCIYLMGPRGSVLEDWTRRNWTVLVSQLDTRPEYKASFVQPDVCDKCR